MNALAGAVFTAIVLVIILMVWGWVAAVLAAIACFAVFLTTGVVVMDEQERIDSIIYDEHTKDRH